MVVIEMSADDGSVVSLEQDEEQSSNRDPIDHSLLVAQQGLNDITIPTVAKDLAAECFPVGVSSPTCASPSGGTPHSSASSSGRPSHKRKPNQFHANFYPPCKKGETAEQCERATEQAAPLEESPRNGALRNTQNVNLDRPRNARTVQSTPEGSRTPSIVREEDRFNTSSRLPTPRRLNEQALAAVSAPRLRLPLQRRLVPSSVWWLWDSKPGKSLNEAPSTAVSDE